MKGWLLVLTLVNLALANAIVWFVIAQAIPGDAPRCVSDGLPSGRLGFFRLLVVPRPEGRSKWQSGQCVRSSR